MFTHELKHLPSVLLLLSGIDSVSILLCYLVPASEINEEYHYLWGLWALSLVFRTVSLSNVCFQADMSH